MKESALADEQPVATDFQGWIMADVLPLSPSRGDEWLPLVERLARAGDRLRRAVAAQLAATDLSEVQFWLLWCCAQTAARGRSQVELATLLDVSPAQVSGLVESLRRADLLAGERCTTDRRRQLWRLTAAGQTKVAAATAAVESHLRCWLSAANVARETFPGEFSEALDRLVSVEDLHTISRAPAKECA